jgi:hypothetical protein
LFLIFLNEESKYKVIVLKKEQNGVATNYENRKERSTPSLLDSLVL